MFAVELEQVPDSACRHGPKEKLAVNKPNTRYYPGPNLGQSLELSGKVDKARETEVYTRLEKSSKNFKGSESSSQYPSYPS